MDYDVLLLFYLDVGDGTCGFVFCYFGVCLFVFTLNLFVIYMLHLTGWLLCVV